MSPEDFENKLKQQPIRPLPAEWRADILAAASAASSVPSRAPASKPSWLSTIISHLSTISPLRPRALAGLAAVWVLIFAFHFSARDASRTVAGEAPMSREVIAEVREQRRFYAEMVGLRETRDAEPPRIFLPRPRSEGRCQTITA